MIPLKFTPSLGEEIVTAAQKFCAAHKTSQCSPVVMVAPGGKVTARADVCYAPTASEFNSHKSSDIIGFMYRGGGSGDDTGNMSCTEYLGPEAKDYLSHLMHKDSPFKDVFPYIWKTDVDDIMADKVIVCHNLSDKKLNAGLLWTFAQATRFMFEHPSRMKTFQYLRSKYPTNPNLVLLATYVLQPMNKNNPDGLWTSAVQGHCAPLGSLSPWQKAYGFLNGKLIKRDAHGPSGSASCFAMYDQPIWKIDWQQPIRKPLEQFVQALMTGERIV